MLNIDRPHQVAFVDRIDMVNLNAHVPGRMRPVERAHFHAFHPIQHPGCSGFQTQVDFPGVSFDSMAKPVFKLSSSFSNT